MAIDTGTALLTNFKVLPILFFLLLNKRAFRAPKPLWPWIPVCLDPHYLWQIMHLKIMAAQGFKYIFFLLLYKMALLWVKQNPTKSNQTKKYKSWSPESCTVQLKLLLHHFHFRANISHRVACNLFKLGMGSAFQWNIILVCSLNLTAGCSCSFLSDPWGSAVQKCHPGGIAACPVAVPVPVTVGL